MWRKGPSALRRGLIVGAAGAIFALMLDALVLISRQTPDAGVACGGGVAFLAILALCVEAGNMAATVSGRVSDGTISGLIAGVMAGVGLGLLSPVNEILNGRARTTPVAVTIGIVVTIALAACTMAGLGAELGALGSLIGQSRCARAEKTRSTAGEVPGDVASGQE